MSFIIGIALLGVLAALLAAAPLWRRARRSQAAFAAVFVAGIAGGVYLLTGRPDLALSPPQADAQEAGDVLQMVENLAARLERAPEDPEGWTMLGRAYVLMGRYQDAARAFNEAVRRTPREDADLLASLAEARVLADPPALEGEAGALFERALELDPENPRGLWYGGLAAEARGDSTLALERWQTLLERGLPPEFRNVVEGRIASIDPGLIDALVTVEVELSPGLEDALPAGGVLFVFLRPAGETGGGLPLAARRLEYFEFPETLPLTRRDLLRGGELPPGDIMVTARISADGDPAPGPGDVEGSARWNAGETAEVRLLLDSLRQQ